MTSGQQGLDLSIVPPAAVVAARQAQLEAVLYDLRIFGEVIGANSTADHSRFEVQLAPGCKLRRAILLADDVAEGAGALAGTIADAGKAGRIGINLRYRAYIDLRYRRWPPPSTPI